MKTVKQLQLSGLIVMLVLASACRQKPKDGLTDTYTSGVIAIAADESFRPIVQEEIDVFEGLFPLAGIVPRYVTEVEAVNLLLKQADSGGDELLQQPQVFPARDKDCDGWTGINHQSEQSGYLD